MLNCRVYSAVAQLVIVDTMTWWADNNKLLPTVALLGARYLDYYLSMPATSVLSERRPCHCHSYFTY